LVIENKLTIKIVKRGDINKPRGEKNRSPGDMGVEMNHPRGKGVGKIKPLRGLGGGATTTTPQPPPIEHHCFELKSYEVVLLI
jgi:hypothetical protein